MIDSLQLAANHRVATPVYWKQGEEVITADRVAVAYVTAIAALDHGEEAVAARCRSRVGVWG